MTTSTPATGALLDALEALRAEVARLALALEVPGVSGARRARRELVAQLDDYVLPRLRRLDAPLLVVVGGGTGAGKSTLVNAIVGRAVTTPGVLRPTTRAPVLLHHPDDADWFTGPRILPGMARTTRTGAGEGTVGVDSDPGTLHLVGVEAVPRGLALVDAPDIDSLVTANRELATQLLAAADLWVFVTSAARYADAVPWDTLRTAAQRGTALAVVLDRVPDGAAAEIQPHLAGMLGDHGLGDAPLFTIAETPLDDGMLPASAATPLRDWLRALAADAASRTAVVRRTLDGALDSLRERVGDLAVHAEEQAAAVAVLRSAAEATYAGAVDAVDAALTDGSLLRGEVLARWQEFVGTGELLRNLEARVGRLRDRAVAALRGRPPPERGLSEALETGVEALVLATADDAAERVSDLWRAQPAGAALLDDAAAVRTGGADAAHAAGGPVDLSRAAPDLTERTSRTVRDWQGTVLELVRREGQRKRTTARFTAYGLNGAALLLMMATFASTAGLTGAEVAVAGGASALSQKVLEALLGDQAVRSLAQRARTDLRARVEVLLAQEAERYARLLPQPGPAETGPGGTAEPGDAEVLRAAARALERAR